MTVVDGTGPIPVAGHEGRRSPGRSARRSLFESSSFGGAALPALLGIIAVAVTAALSWRPSLWGDEAASIMSAERPWGTLWHEVSHVDAVHASYYVFLHVWIDVFGASPFSVRFPSAIAVGLSVAAVVVLVRSLGSSTTTQWLVGGATMLVPRLSYQGVDARAYAIDAAIASWAVVVVVLTVRGRLPRRRGWIIAGVLIAVGTYFFMYVGLMAVVAGVVAATLAPRADRRRQLVAWVLSSVGVVVATLPVIGLGLSEKSQVAFLAHRVTTDPYSVWVTVWFDNAPAAATCWILVAVAVVSSAVVVVSRVTAARRSGASRPGFDAQAALVWIALLWGFIPGIVLIGADPVVHDFSARYMTFTAPAAGVLVGIGVERVLGWRRWAGVVAIVVAAAVLVPTWAASRTPTAFNASDWAIISRMVHERAQPGDQVAFDTSVRPSRRMLLAMRTYPSDYTGLDEVQVTVPFWQNSSWDDVALSVDQAVAAGRFHSDRVWLLQDAHGGTVDHEGEAALQHDGYRVVGRWRAPSSELVEFER